MRWWAYSLRKYADFSGRASRAEYWMFALLLVIAQMMALVVMGLLGFETFDDQKGAASFAVLLVLGIPWLAVSVRRLHDRGKSGRWILLELVPLVGVVLLNVAFAFPGDPDANKYGPPPSGPSEKSPEELENKESEMVGAPEYFELVEAPDGDGLSSAAYSAASPPPQRQPIGSRMNQRGREWSPPTLLAGLGVLLAGTGVFYYLVVHLPRIHREEAEAVRELAENPAGIEWVRIPRGSFTMGCTSGDSECDGDESPPHRVTVRRFELAATGTTVGQYQRCVSTGRCSAVSSPGFSQGQDHPVVNVSWHEAKAFCSWASGRLPSEAEWEYAARGGRDGWKYPWGNSVSHDNANYSGTGGRDSWSKASPVKSFAANGFGLYDMSGNVWEWVEDVWHGNYNGAPSDGSAWTSGGDSSLRVLRGGSWGSPPGHLRVSSRGRSTPGNRGGDDRGFRCARMGNSP